VRRISGWSPQAGLPLASIGWLRQARPDVFKATDRFLSVNDFLAQRLTGSAATSPSVAGEMLLTDIRTGQWSEELCRLVGIDPEALSPILSATAPLGPIGPEISHLTGLSPETVVVNGGQDHSCEALALGLTSAGAGLLACGTAWVINAVVEALPEADPVGGIPADMDLNYHVLPGRWIASRFLGGLGACVEWWLDQCGQSATRGRDELWSAFDEALAETAAGSGGLIYLPPTGAGGAQGSVAGRRQGGFAGLRLDHAWADMGRAILEGAAYELRGALEQLGSTGLPLREVWMIGGAAQSPLWPQIVADASRVPILLSQYSHGPALGAAILAGLGLGLFDSVESAQDRFQVSARRLEPQERQAQAYDRQFATYRWLARELAQ
jgi:xylulokinase